MSAPDPVECARAEATARHHLGRLDRRRFLGVGLLAAGSALAPIGCGGVPETLRPPPDLDLRQLSPRAYATFNAAALRLVGPELATAIGEGRVDPAALADRWADREPGLGGTLGLALTVLEFGVPPVIPKWRPFTRLAPSDQDAVLDGMMTARFDVTRDVFRGVRSLVFVSVYGHTEGVRATHHPGPFGTRDVSIADAMLPPT